MTPIEQSGTRAIIEQLAPKLLAEGYTIVYEPPRQLLPPFMGGYVPDAIALGQDKNIAIEVIVEGRDTSDKHRNLKELFKNSPGWELYLYFVRPGQNEQILPVSLAAIDKSISLISELMAANSLGPSLLMSWATFEALARFLAPERYRKPQTPGRLVETLANAGYITPSEADFLRDCARTRNSLVHGDLEVPIKVEDIERLIDVLRVLRDQAVGAPN